MEINLKENPVGTAGTAHRNIMGMTNTSEAAAQYSPPLPGPGFFGAGGSAGGSGCGRSEIGADDEPLAAASTLFTGLSGVGLLSTAIGVETGGVGAGGVVGSAAGLSAGGASASGVGSVAPTDIGRADGGGAGTFTGGALMACAGCGAGSVGGTLTSIGFGGSAGFGGMITAVATGTLAGLTAMDAVAAGDGAGTSSCGDKCAMTTLATTPTATA